MLLRLVRPACSILVLGVLAAAPLSAAPPETTRARLKAMQQQILMREPAEKAEKLERFRKWRKSVLKRGGPGSRTRRRVETRSDLRYERPADAFVRARLAALQSTSASLNVLANDTTGEPDGSAQSEVCIAAIGENVLAAWNDGIGVFNGGDTQGYAYSTDGGQTWTDGGAPPNAGIGVWSSDPVVTVNEKTGAFYYCGLTDQPVDATNGIAMVRGTFSGGAFVWGTPVSIRTYDNCVGLLDKQWMAADSLTGNLYITYTQFILAGCNNFVSDLIRFERSTNDGQTWTNLQTLSDPGDAGYVQGSRPAVGPAGEIYAVWHTIGQPSNSPDGRDFLKIRRSTNSGGSFDPEVIADRIFSNFPSGAPGFNRSIGITFPGIAVDRSNGPRRGRVYLSWNESLNFYNDVFPDPDLGPHLSETENNNGAAIADPFQIGSVVRGTIQTGSDLDYFRWSAVQGQTYIFYLDSLTTTLDASVRIFCTDEFSNLAWNQNGIGGTCLLVFTAPTTANYYLRVASLAQGRTGRYRVLTTANTPQADRARDHRDLFVKSSDNGIIWGPTVRVNDSPGYFDDFLPEVAVDGNGRVFVAAFDWRDAVATCGGGSNAYLYRSDDGGASWTSGTRISEVTTDWNVTYSALIPNQGDYIGLFARDSTAIVAWADGRSFNPDVYVASTRLNCVSAPVTLVSAQVAASLDTVTAIWSAPSGTAAVLQRRVGGGAYADVGPVVADGSDRIVYVDTAVSPGVTYGYRLAVSGFCSAFAGEVSVPVPGITGPQLAIVLVEPNPTDGAIRVSFTLASGAPATLALFDIAGRRVRDADVTAFGPGGPHLITLNPAGDLQAGVYFVRLSQSGETKDKRVIVRP